MYIYDCVSLILNDDDDDNDDECKVAYKNDSDYNKNNRLDNDFTQHLCVLHYRNK